MPIRQGYVSGAALDSGQVTAGLSNDLDNYAFAPWGPTAFAVAGSIGIGSGPRRLFRQHQFQTVRAGSRGENYTDDFYGRIYVNPVLLDVGNLVTEQTRYVEVWNAFLRPTVLEDAVMVGMGGIDVVAPGPTPLTFRALQLRVWQLNLRTDGPPVIDGSITFTFEDLYGIKVTIGGRRLQAWPVPADWGSDLNEALEWLTEIQQSFNGIEDAQPLRQAPRRTWEFDLVEGRRERRIVENAVYDWAARVWALPVMPDISLLANALPAGSELIPISTLGLDYRPGGLAMIWRSAQEYELVEAAAVASDHVALARPTLRSWKRGDRVYPCRSARLTEAPQWRRKNDQVVTARVQFEATEPCDWPGVAPVTVYHGFPVLEWRGDEAAEPTLQPSRQLLVVDGDIGLVSAEDTTNLAWSLQSHAWVLFGRAERSAFRDLLYWLQGRYQRLWVPTWADDVELVDTVAGAAVVLQVAWSGITSYLRQQPGRRHLRIELNDGTVMYREVTASVEVSVDVEALSIDSPLGRPVEPRQVRVICWMALSRLAADRIEINHITDIEGVAQSRTTFAAIGGNEP